MSPSNDLVEALGEDFLKIYVREMQKFNQAFCDAFVEGIDATIKLEVKVNKRKLEHVRADAIRFSRP